MAPWGASGKVGHPRAGRAEGRLCPAPRPGNVFGGLGRLTEGHCVPQVGSPRTAGWGEGSPVRLLCRAGLEKGEEGTGGCDTLAGGGRAVPGFGAEAFVVAAQPLAGCPSEQGWGLCGGDQPRACPQPVSCCMDSSRDWQRGGKSSAAAEASCSRQCSAQLGRWHRPCGFYPR